MSGNSTSTAAGRVRMLALLLLGASAMACGGDAPRVTVSGQVNDIFSGQPIEGARFCRWSASSDCSHTDAEGQLVLRLPLNSDEWIQVDHEVFYPVLVGIFTDTEDYEPPGVFGLIPLDIVEVVLAQAGVQLEPDHGHVLLYVYQEPGGDWRSGATLDIDPPPGGTQGYLDDQGEMSLDATATGTPGVGNWINIPPGDYVATVSHPTYECHAILAMPDAVPNTFQLKLLPDRITYLIVYCN